MGLNESIGNLHYLPIITFLIIPGTFVITYTIAVTSGDVAAVFPYISDTGTHAPQSCIFGQLLNMASALVCVIIYIRYSQAKVLSISLELPASLSKWNRAGLVLGLLTSLGLSVVANFQETTALLVHLIGAVVCFGCGTAYFWVQAWVSYKVRPSGCSLRIAHTRFSLALASTVFFVTTFVGAFAASASFEGEDMFQWSKDEGGWEWHLVSTISEWLCVGCFCLYILTFAHDFRGMELSRPEIIHSFAY